MSSHLALALISIFSPVIVSADLPPIRIHFLGTGGPEITRDRMGPSTLIQAGGESFLFDAGRGVLQRMGEDRLNIPEVKKVLFTHLHSDHIEGLPALWMTSWFITKRNDPMHFWGPPGTEKMIQGMRSFMHHDVKARVNPVVKSSGVEFEVMESTGGMVYQSGGVLIKAIVAEHGDGNPSLGYIFSYSGYSVLITGDSTYTSAFGRVAKKMDVTICNVYAPSQELIANLDDYPAPIPIVVRAVSAKLASPEQAAQMFNETGARLGVYTHNIFYDSTEDQVIQRTRSAGFAGQILIASDRTQVDVGEKITIHAPSEVPKDLEINSLNFKRILGTSE